jgi:uncharacterized membrane protein
MALWLVFILIGISLIPETDQSYKKMLRILAIVMLAYFFMIVKFVMPALMPPGLEYIHLTFGKLGNGLSEILSHILFHPVDTFLLLFQSPYVNEPYTFWIKAETHVYLLLSGGALLFVRPQFLFMLLPVLAQKLLHDDMVKWGINLHYSIEFVPILAIGSVYVISKITAKDRLRNGIAITLVCMTALLTYSSFNFRYSKWFDNTTIHFLHPKHYKQTFDVKEVHHIINQIPDEYNVAASPNLTPHLAFRRVIYSFPMWDKAEVIVLLKQQESYFPFDKNRYDKEIETLKVRPDFHIIKETNDIIVLARNNIDFEIHP